MMKMMVVYVCTEFPSHLRHLNRSLQHSFHRQILFVYHLIYKYSCCLTHVMLYD